MPDLPPKCDTCGQLLRPAVVWFGETLPDAAIERVESELERGFDLALIVGTEAVFGYIQDWALRARRGGALLVEVNPAATVLSATVDVRLQSAAGEVLGLLV